jgi:bromodomain and PHD finger-containing protein 1
MKIEPVQNSPGGGGFNVRKTAFCDVHCPPDGTFLPMMDNGIDSDEEKPNTVTPAAVKEQSRIKMRQARKILAEKRNATPIVSIPIIPDDRLVVVTEYLR